MFVILAPLFSGRTPVIFFLFVEDGHSCGLQLPSMSTDLQFKSDLLAWIVYKVQILGVVI
jgi:hypothetical protein